MRGAATPYHFADSSLSRPARTPLNSEACQPDSEGTMNAGQLAGAPLRMAEPAVLMSISSVRKISLVKLILVLSTVNLVGPRRQAPSIEAAPACEACALEPATSARRDRRGENRRR